MFFDDTLPFAADLTADVQNMKDKGVQYVNTCMDTNEVIKLQREMQKQGMHAEQNLPNAYDHDFVEAERGVDGGDLHRAVVRAVGDRLRSRRRRRRT